MPFTCSKKLKLLISGSTHSKNKNKLVAGSTKLGTACQVDPMSAERLGIFVFKTVGAAAPSPSSLPVHATVLGGTARHKHFTSIHPYELTPTRRLINTHWLYANYQSRLDPSTFNRGRKPNVGGGLWDRFIPDGFIQRVALKRVVLSSFIITGFYLW